MNRDRQDRTANPTSASGHLTAAGERLRAQADHWRVLARESERLLEAVREASRGSKVPTAELLRAAAFRIRKVRLSVPELTAEAEGLADFLAGSADEAEAAARSVLLDGLRAASEAASLNFARLGDDPLEVGIGPLEVTLPEQGRAQLRLGREPITEAPQDPQEIVEACTREMASLRENLIEAAAFHDLLHRAWRMALAARGPTPDGRVDLVDLLVPLALLELGPDRWRRVKQERGVVPWPRVRLAYQLYRLRREQALECNGLRVELAAATLSTTRDSRNVLHVLSGDGRGQYYGSIRLVDAAAALTAGRTGPPSPDSGPPAAQTSNETVNPDALGGVLDLFGSRDDAED